MIEQSALLRLLTWLSPAFPTGGFAYSHALEWSVEAGAVTDEADLIDWIGDILAQGALWSDAILLRHAHRAEAAQLPELARLATAIAPSLERRRETLAQGAAFREAARPWPAPELQSWPDAPLPYPIAIGILAAAQTIAEDDTVLAFLHASTANLISAAVRLIPLGQSAGLRAQAALEPGILATAGLSKTATLDDLGTACWRSDIASMRHETQYTRLFRT
jgi:urease accessory protein